MTGETAPTDPGARPVPRADGAGRRPAAVGDELLAEVLLEEGLLDGEEIARAAEESRRHSTGLGFSVVALGLVPEEELTEALARELGVPAARPPDAEIEASLLDLVPGSFAAENLVLPLSLDGDELTVAMAAPTDLELVDALRFITRRDVRPAVAGEYTLRTLVDHHYSLADARLARLLAELEEQEVEWIEEEPQEGAADGGLRAQVEDAPVVRLIDGILADAVRREASDVHIEPYAERLRVRYRIDGVLHEVLSPPSRLTAALVSRVKILADLDIAERRVPQDGRVQMRTEGDVVDFRVSTLPVTAGEKIVLRVLDRSSLRLRLESFGMEPKAERDFLDAIGSPYGMILVTGPTGAGKTTTLYAAMDRLNTPEVNIMTAEDPVEYELEGINQTQVKPAVGLDFAAALRAFLRQDPDVVLVGEIRDFETASIAVKASLTGHLVLATLHTNDAAGTVTRLLEMGVEPFNVTSALKCVTAQRLVRRICERCRTEASYTPPRLEAAGVAPEDRDGLVLHRGAGCRACDGTGYSGRQGLYEVLPVSGDIQRMILRGARAGEIERAATDLGMLTLRRDGMAKARRGVTTLEEVLRETGTRGRAGLRERDAPPPGTGPAEGA